MPPVSPNFPTNDKRYVSAPKLDDMGQDTLKRTLPRPQGDSPVNGEYVLVEAPELIPGNSGYEYLDEEGQRMLLKVTVSVCM